MRVRNGLLGIVMLMALVMGLPSFSFAADSVFDVKTIKFAGATVIPEADLKAMVKSYEGRLVTLAELKQAATLITNEYRNRGFAIATALVLEQKIEDGIATITVVEGKIGDIRIQGDHKYYSDDFIRKHFVSALSGQPYNVKSLERALLLLNEYPKLKVTSMLVPGKKPETTDLLVTANNSIPISLTLDYNNYGSLKMGGYDRFGSTLNVGNLGIEGSQLSIKGSASDNMHDYRYGRAAYTAPLNSMGTELGIYYSAGTFNVGQELANLGVNGKIESYGIFASHPFIKERVQTLTVESGFDFKNVRQFVFDTEPYSRDLIRAAHVSTNYLRNDSMGRTAATLTGTMGAGDLFDGEVQSRDGASNSFSRYNLELARFQRLADPLYLVARASGQYGANIMPASEQLMLGGATTVRGYEDGEIGGDTGYNVSVEARYSPLANHELLQLAAFVDHGGVHKRNALVGEKNDEYRTGAGVGVLLGLPYDINIQAAVGFPLDPASTAEGDKAILYVQGSVTFGF